MTRNQFSDPTAVLDFIRAGKATFTIESEKTGNHLTYKVTSVEGSNTRYFVKLLGGSDNENSYYIGMIVEDTFKSPVAGAHANVVSHIGWKFILTKASRVNDSTTPVKALRYVLEALSKNEMPAKTKIFHEGKCGRCGRKLTVPESIERGIGPECAGILGVDLPKELPDFEIGPSEYRQAIGGINND